MYSRRGFVERVDRVTGHSWRINCRRHFRRSDGCPANKSNLGTVSLDDGRLSRFRKIPACRDLPIIAVTAKAMKGDREKCMEAGAWDYLSKPVDTELMVGVLRAWLSR